MGILGEEKPDSPYHFGVIVADLDKAKEQYTSVFGCTWTIEDRFVVRVLVDGVEQDSEIRYVYSIEGPPHVELLEEITGAAWNRPDGKLDHIGYWADDLVASVSELDARGFPAVVRGFTPSGEPDLFSCHRISPGFWLELVPAQWKSELAAWIERSR